MSSDPIWRPSRDKPTTARPGGIRSPETDETVRRTERSAPIGTGAVLTDRDQDLRAFCGRAQRLQFTSAL